jgi:hypothetical protein
MARDDYSFLFDPPKETDLFTRTLYYPRSPEPAATANSPVISTGREDVEVEMATMRQSSMGDNRHAATLSKFSTGVLSSNSAAQETVAPFLNDHIPDQVHIPDRRGKVNVENRRDRVYCYRHQPDLRCPRRTPQEDTVAEIQKVSPLTQRAMVLTVGLDDGYITHE